MLSGQVPRVGDFYFRLICNYLLNSWLLDNRRNLLTISK